MRSHPGKPLSGLSCTMPWGTWAPGYVFPVKSVPINGLTWWVKSCVVFSTAQAHSAHAHISVEMYFILFIIFVSHTITTQQMNILTQKYSFFLRKFLVVYCFDQKYNDMLSHSLWHSCGTEYGLMYLYLLFNKHVCRIIAINSKLWVKLRKLCLKTFPILQESPWTTTR